jgi:hypothetical protein
MRSFNAEYRRRRKAANASGHGFMTYGRARARLRQAVAGVLAAGGGRDLDLTMVRKVLDG